MHHDPAEYKLWLHVDPEIEGRVHLSGVVDFRDLKIWRDVREFGNRSVWPESATVTCEGTITFT